MKTTHQLLATALAVASLTATPSLHAESTYGYAASGAGAVTANARVNVTVTVPRLILLRVGTGDGVVNTATITTAPTAPATPTDGNNQAFGWDGTAPTFSAGTSNGLTAYAWTNIAGGASINGAISTPDAGTTGLAPTAITVAAVNIGALPALGHPGANTGSFGAITIPRNEVRASTWTYNLSAAAAAAAAAGTFAQTITYTATSL